MLLQWNPIECLAGVVMAAALIGFTVLVIIVFWGLTGQAATGGCNTMNCNITNDPATWPSGDSVWTVCHQIAHAEGAEIAGSNPDRLNNPGDISDYSSEYGFENHSGSAVTKFPNKQTGWQKLYDKIYNAFVGQTSDVYSPNMTWTQFAQKYAADWQNWVDTVTGPLNVSPDDRVGDYFGT